MLIDLKYAVITIEDGGSHSITLNIGEGNLQFTEKRNVEVVKRRGVLSAMRLADEEPVDVSFQFVWETLTTAGGDEPPTVEDALKQQGNAADWVTVSTDPEAPFAVNIVVVYTPPCDAPVQTITIAEFYYQELAHSFEDSTVDCTGLSNRTEVTQVNT